MAYEIDFLMDAGFAPVFEIAIVSPAVSGVPVFLAVGFALVYGAADYLRVEFARAVPRGIPGANRRGI